jgi:hypothetical protein
MKRLVLLLTAALTLTGATAAAARQTSYGSSIVVDKPKSKRPAQGGALRGTGRRDMCFVSV